VEVAAFGEQRKVEGLVAEQARELAPGLRAAISTSSLAAASTALKNSIRSPAAAPRSSADARRADRSSEIACALRAGMGYSKASSSTRSRTFAGASQWMTGPRLE
jgi:hypothetical protein